MWRDESYTDFDQVPLDFVEAFPCPVSVFRVSSPPSVHGKSCGDGSFSKAEHRQGSGTPGFYLG